jgi:adenylate cyclase
LTVRHHVIDNSIFFGDWYVIRGVAGAILWRLVNDYEALGRRHFTNRELRTDPRLGLPAKNHNLEVRLSMLARRLDEVQAPIEIDRSQRGIIRVAVWQSLLLRQIQPISFRVFQPLVEVASVAVGW